MAKALHELIAHTVDTDKRIDQILADLTGQPLEKIAADTERDYYMSGTNAVEYGIIDEVIVKRGL